MFKKIELWVLLLFFLLFFIILILFGSLLKYHYDSGQKFQNFQKIVVFLASIPSNLKNISFKKDQSGKILIQNKTDMPTIMPRHSNEKRFERYLKKNREELLVLSRYDGDLKRSIVEIIDLNSFKKIHTYKHNISSMNNMLNNTNINVEKLKKDTAEIRFEYRHPLILSDGSLVSDSGYAPLFKIDFCSNLEWLNQEYRFHHSKSLDIENNILVPAQIIPRSSAVSSLTNKKKFIDDAILKISIDGKIKYVKSVFEILIENEITKKVRDISLIDDYESDPIHLNDIEPALSDTKYWKKNDLFLSVRNLHAIIHYRPSSNEIINFIRGPFNNQHDVDIVSDKQISIFNNNNKITEGNKRNNINLGNNNYSNVVIYNFETNEFSKKFDNSLKKLKFKTHSQGLSEILDDGSMMVEEQNHGRLIFLNKDGKKEWQFVNKDEKGDIYMLSWSRIIKNKKLIKEIKRLIDSKKCLN